MTGNFRLAESAAARSRRNRPRGRNGPVIVSRRDPAVLALAVILADGNKRRLDWISLTEVIVRNNPRQGR